ncbi:hypothetical protein [Jeotgalibacillus terrae]|uniref:Lipoprotein n=1 Tax=Jeotgalibacillus terrae TaxID=587735 RepID=A0ABW5ZK17_9BACL|nr:hypothetical protein [Jeotgalibacillus terrae]MBM7579985.1 hypothetical protein [Jeotgalibacillus terrae]
MKRLLLLSSAFVFLFGCSSEAESQNSAPTEPQDVTEDLDNEETESESTTENTEEPTEIEEDLSEEGQDIQEDSKEEVSTWETTISEIATSDASETEKADQIMIQAASHETTQEEVNIFLEDIIDEYYQGLYLDDVTDHEYMLKNLFKAQVVESFYDDSEQLPEDKFAFDFIQNTKYTYRGVDAVDSESVLANESQMDKTLLEIKY